ncbi:unnamed protein product, partial [Ectocarpus sp. 13 AM-2016]
GTTLHERWRATGGGGGGGGGGRGRRGEGELQEPEEGCNGQERGPEDATCNGRNDHAGHPEEAPKEGRLGHHWDTEEAQARQQAEDEGVVCVEACRWWGILNPNHVVFVAWLLLLLFRLLMLHAL